MYTLCHCGPYFFQYFQGTWRFFFFTIAFVSLEIMNSNNNANAANINNNNSSNSNNTLSMFLGHVKQYLATIPPITKLALYIPIIICILDRIILPLFGLQFDIASHISLTAMHFQSNILIT